MQEPEPTGLTIVYEEPESIKGGKGPWEAADLIRKVTRLDTDTLRDSIREFCGQISLVFEKAEAVVTGYGLESIELSVEITAKGEVRLVASASSEVKGGLKLVFRRAQDRA